MSQGTAYQGRRVLVLGATGFIGRWVARYLTSAGADLTLGVRDLAAASALASVYGIRGLPVRVDLEAPGAISRLLAATRPDIVFNLSGYGVDRGERDSARSRRVNTDVVAEVLDALRTQPATQWSGLRLVHAGSALEYGEVGGDLDEACPPNPTTVYGASKLAATELVTQSAQGGMAAITARLFTVYGPGEHPGRLLPTLLEAAASGATVPLTDGVQQRDFTYVEDVARGLLRLGLLPAATYPVLNLATGKLYQVKDFVLVAARVLHIRKDRLGFGRLPNRPDDMRHSAVRVARVRNLLGWCPDTDIAAGIVATTEFLRRSARGPAEGGGNGV